MHHLQNKPDFTVLVLDESEIFIREMTAGLHQDKNTANILTIHRIAREAKLIIALDAFLTYRSLNVLTLMMNTNPLDGKFTETPTCLTNIEMAGTRMFSETKKVPALHRSMSSIKHQILASIDKGNKVYIIVGKVGNR